MTGVQTCALPISLFPCVVKRRPKLKSKYQGRVEKAIEYAEAIESWEDLVDPCTLTFYCLGPDPSAYVLCLIEIEGKKSKSWVHQYCIRLKEKIFFFLFFFFFFLTSVSFLQK